MIDSALISNTFEKDNKSVSSKLYVRYMVCSRDQLSVQSALDKQELSYRISVHGAIEFLEEITQDECNELKERLAKKGFILLDEKESQLIDRIINVIIEFVHYSDALPKMNFRDIISKYVIKGDDTILKIFSDVKGVSVLQFIVIQKIERVKELMLYGNRSLTEIAELLNYKNKNYLVAQFKKITGLSPSYFKRLKNKRMKVADENIMSHYPSTADS